ncbi:hypothetical protein KEM52_002820, partial [Ascosphaera acerosa]
MAIKTEPSETAPPLPAVHASPSTPSKRPRLSPSDVSLHDLSPSSTTSSPRKGKKRPTSLAEASQEDQLIFRLHQEGKTWSEIADVINSGKAEGQQLKPDAVRMRVKRMKDA